MMDRTAIGPHFLGISLVLFPFLNTHRVLLETHRYKNPSQVIERVIWHRAMPGWLLMSLCPQGSLLHSSRG